MRSSAPAEDRTGTDRPLSSGDVKRLAQIHAAVFAFYVIDGVLFTGMGLLGSVALRFGLLYTAAGCCSASLAVAVFRHGRKTVRELDLNNFLMSAFAVAQMLVAALLAPSTGGLMLMSMMTVLAATALQLSKRKLFAMWLACAVGAAATLLASADTLTVPMSTPGQRLLSALWFAWLLGKCTLVNVEGTRLRQQASDANARLTQALGDVAKLATTDELTVIANRRSIVSELRAALEGNGDRSAASVAVVLFDIDHFKLVNDRFGHATGDTVLREFASLVSRGLRPHDRIGRYGGEEFLLVLKQVKTVASAREAADRLRKSIESFDWSRVVQGLRVTASAGVALIAPNEPAADAIARADRALYAAKGEGRNRVVVAESASITLAAPAGT